MTRARIFIVEDEAATSMNEKEMLEDLGYEVVGICATAEEALKRVAEDKPDVVIMDIHLDGKMDGVEAANRIKVEHGIPVVYVTAFGAKGMLNPDETNGTICYIVKPFTQHELKAHIEQALKVTVDWP